MPMPIRRSSQLGSLGKSPGRSANKVKISDKKADVSMQGLASMAEMDQWKTDMELVNLAMKGDRSFC